MSVQGAFLPAKHRHQLKFRLAVFGLLSSVLVAVSVAFRHGYEALAAVFGKERDAAALSLGLLYLLELAAAVATACTFAAFQRRPDIYDKTDQLVDQQHTVSLLSRFSFSWNRGIFNIAKQRQMEVEDIPNLDFATRSQYLESQFLERGVKGPLWKQLIKAHAGDLALQWFLTLIIALLSLFPQVVLYNFLSRIEQSQERTSADPTIFIWVLGLLLSQILQVGVNNWLKWITASRLEIPVGSLLQSLVFSKALKQYETAPPGQNVDKSSKSSSHGGSGDANGNPGESTGKAKGKVPETRQSVINHMKLDRYFFLEKSLETILSDTSQWPRHNLLHLQQQLPHGHFQAYPRWRLCRQSDGLAASRVRSRRRLPDGSRELLAVQTLHQAALRLDEVPGRQGPSIDRGLARHAANQILGS